ncbi:SH3 domain-containing protein [Salmonella enterica subsp. enterica serovar Newport]
MEKKKTFIATGLHRSEYPDPITFTKGTPVVIGEKYEGNENWINWYFCTVSNHPGGWVPAQLIEQSDKPGYGIANDDYTAKELDVNEGERFQAIKHLNGWVWCRRLSDNEIGWVPAGILEAFSDDQPHSMTTS